MIINRTEFLERPIKPGCDPRPLKPVATYDPQYAIDRCLECSRDVRKCKGSCAEDEAAPHVSKSRRTELAVLELIKAGVTDIKKISRILGVCEQTAYSARARLKRKGELKA